MDNVTVHQPDVFVLYEPSEGWYIIVNNEFIYEDRHPSQIYYYPKRPRKYFKTPEDAKKWLAENGLVQTQ